jgi:hypothetical protein
MKFRRIIGFPLVCLGFTMQAPRAQADVFGADVAVLAEILAQAIQQLTQLREIFANGEDTLGLMRDINRGIRDGLDAIRVINPKFNPGLYGKLDQADRVLGVVQDLYGKIPQTADAKLQESQDQSVAESLAMHGNIYRYADQVDSESQRMLAHAQVVNPQGVGKLQAQSLAVLIGVTTQVLRTNSAMLKLMAENLALSNRHEKLNAENFRRQYDGLSSAFSALPKETKLPTVRGGN